MVLFNTRRGGTPAHCDASRISAGVHFRESAPAGRNHAKHFQNLPTVCSKGPKSSQISPQTLPKPPQSEPKSIQKPSWSQFWANAWKKFDFERSKSGQETAKSTQRRPKTTPNPSQIEPKTLPKLIFVGFLDAFCPAPNLHRFFHYFKIIFYSPSP